MSRYRALSASGDYTFGQGSANFLVNSRAMVGQKVQTRLLLWRGEWFLDVTAGTPWLQNVVGLRSNPAYVQTISQVILGTSGVTAITSFNLVVGPRRTLTGTVDIDTVYGQTQVAF